MRFGQKLRCYLLLFLWIKKHFRRMMKDVVIAADQVLYNIQVPKPKTADLKQVRGESA